MDGRSDSQAPPVNRRLVLGGWIGFTLSGVLYLIAGFQSKDELVIIGSLVWLVAVSFFLVAFARNK